jgi:hypothetical protein
MRRLEKALGRPLTELERSGEIPVKYKKPNGQWHIEHIPRYNIRDFFSK